MKGIYGLIKGFPDSIKFSYERDTPKTDFKPKRIVVVGMGANYNAGLLLREFLREDILVDVFQRKFIQDEESLIVFLSYSGDTKEVLEIFDSVKGKNILVVSSGGELLKKAKKRKCSFVEVPSGLHARFTFCECFFPVLKFLENSNIVKKRLNIKRILRALEKEERHIQTEARNLSKEIGNKILLFYSSEYFWPVAYRFQSSVEEDVKVICHANRITELFHNEIQGLPNTKFFPMLFVDRKETSIYRGQIDFFKKHINSFFYFGYENYSKEVRTFLAFYFAYYLAYYISLTKDSHMGETVISDEIKKR